ncbi:MAG: AMP-binding protein [Planctomycetota bacterium]|nr:MAG: AMP-binding protein [Planctomycetota bacterium]
MHLQLKYETLIELFNLSLTPAELAEKNYLEVIRTHREESLTFDRLRDEARDFAAHLIQKRNIQPKDKIAVLGKNRADWDIAFWAIILAGAVPVLIDPERRIEGVKNHLLHTDTKLLVLADDYQDAAARQKLEESLLNYGIGLVEMTVHDGHTFNDTELSSSLTKISDRIQPDDTAVILCTSGTTGDPREVELTHANLIANVQGALKVVHVTSADKLGHIMPPHHSFGLTVGKLLPLWVGATGIYTNKYRHIFDLIKQKGITVFIAIPALFTVLARRIEEALASQKQKSWLIKLADRCLPKSLGRIMVRKLGWQRLRFFVSGSAPIPRWVLEVFWKRGIQLWEGYGTTEVSPIYGFNPNPNKLGSVGKPIPALSVKIVDEQGDALEPGQKGEILLAGPCVMKGYYKNPNATGEVIETDGDRTRWLHTGDLGYLDADGYLFITGRKKFLIVLPSGKNVNPELVELALSRAPYVEEMVVVPHRHGREGAELETVKAIVRPDWNRLQNDTGLSRYDLVNRPEKVKDLLWKSINKHQQKSQNLADFEKIPSKAHLEILIKEFEKTSTGKIKRTAYIQPARRNP